MEKLARTWGYPVRTPFEKEGFQEGICSKNHVFLKADINSNSFGSFSEFFFKKLQKNCRKLKIYQKLLKNERKFQIWQFLSYFNMQYLKRKDFSIRIQFQTEKLWFVSRKIEKIKLFHFFFQNRSLPLVFKRAFLKFVPKNLKTEFAFALETFWN